MEGKGQDIQRGEKIRGKSGKFALWKISWKNQERLKTPELPRTKLNLSQQSIKKCIQCKNIVLCLVFMFH